MGASGAYRHDPGLGHGRHEEPSPPVCGPPPGSRAAVGRAPGDAHQRRLRGRALDAEAAEKFKSAVLHHLALLDHRRGWVQQFHLGALRNTNARARRTLGPDKGFDSIGDFDQASPLARFLDRLDDSNQLAKTILYNLNPRDNELFALRRSLSWLNA